MRIALAVAVLFVMGCPKPPPPPSGGNGGGQTAARTLVFAKGHELFEGSTFKNACGADSDCKVGGCSGEVCSAEEGVNTTCVVHPDQPRDASCGCVNKECVWYRAESATPASTGAAMGMPCSDGKCAEGLSCLTYYGIAGPRGPAFTSCEISCAAAGARCPDGHTCITIADGPGRVCRPK